MRCPCPLPVCSPCTLDAQRRQLFHHQGKPGLALPAFGLDSQCCGPPAPQSAPVIPLDDGRGCGPQAQRCLLRLHPGCLYRPNMPHPPQPLPDCSLDGAGCNLGAQPLQSGDVVCGQPQLPQLQQARPVARPTRCHRRHRHHGHQSYGSPTWQH